jgi:hypothetical protein
MQPSAIHTDGEDRQDAEKLHNNKNTFPVLPNPGQKHPENPVPDSDLWPFCLLFHNCELLTQGKVLKQKTFIS